LDLSGGDELIHVFGKDFALFLSEMIKENRDVKPAVFFVFRPDDYSPAFDIKNLFLPLGNYRQVQFYRDLCERGHVFVDAAIRPYAADILRLAAEIVPVGDDLYRKFLVDPRMLPSFIFYRRHHYWPSFSLGFLEFIQHLFVQ
jgi:hypothetical protein